MDPIYYINRQTGKKEQEKVYGEKALRLLYGNWLFRKFFVPIISKIPFFSAFYGFWQRMPSTRLKIRPFIKEHHIDSSEFLAPVSSFRSFNDFFIRLLKSSARPIIAEEDVAIIPADGRYYFYPSIDHVDGFVVKGQKFDVYKLLEDKELADLYVDGSLVIARLCPSDYHRFHFPCEGVAKKSKLINGWLYSVNPIAIKRDIEIFTKNKRALCEIDTRWGKVLYIEVGATNVGSIHQTYIPDRLQRKGAEKGFFSFGASSLILLFPKGSIIFDNDLIAATEEGIEMRCLMGQSMGRLVSASQFAK